MQVLIVSDLNIIASFLMVLWHLHLSLTSVCFAASPLNGWNNIVTLEKMESIFFIVGRLFSSLQHLLFIVFFYCLFLLHLRCIPPQMCRHIEKSTTAAVAVTYARRK